METVKVKEELLSAILVICAIIFVPLIEKPWAGGALVAIFALVLYYYFGSFTTQASLIALSALYGLSLLPMPLYLTTLAIVMSGDLIFRLTGARLRSYVYAIIAMVISSYLVFLYIGEISALTVLFGINVAILLKTILQGRRDALIIETFGVALTLYLFHQIDYKADISLIVLAVLIAFGFSYFSFRAKTADISGLFSGALIGIILIIFTDARWFLIMLVFFILGSAATRYRYDWKEKKGIEQAHGGARGYKNVFANGIVAAIAALLYGITYRPEFIALYIGSISTAAADTLASEIGVTGNSPFLITTLKQVPRGTNGGVTWIGEFSAALGGLAIAIVSYALGLIDTETAVICAVAGIFGTNLDSFIGATLENKGIIGNAGTNLIATFGGGLFAFIFTYLL